ncbi:MAG TPA: ankyrin repeat domain-containing protein, partial [Candidatus Kapabacteria bacterium]
MDKSAWGRMLDDAILKNNVSSARTALENGANPNSGQEPDRFLDSLDSVTIPSAQERHRALFYPRLNEAIINGNIPMVELLLQHGADPNLQTGTGESALYNAVLLDEGHTKAT